MNKIPNRLSNVGLVLLGIDSISLNPDTVLKTTIMLSQKLNHKK